ncbi:3',5'-cyclic AMP phosphodiesterase CpdA [Nakamurella panacisegetis]|uniref:3',5'-cyclic AMP phosphodiesterase CpdA n=1 Tax=Nakamurella panacisegetis TaxID=1090615 RepID=A0A1H0QYI8_9ACTN|nr:metallophosphoesterase [Nakamurella panacisegetis]SDP22215.1 3',5'-cyclic AMP phosphodiesterase CpdA [Nakamurella panacisegetis]
MTTAARTPDGEPAEVPDLVIAHLSDTHLTSTGVRYNGLIDPQLALLDVAAALRAAKADGRGPDIIVVSGDLTDSGDPAAYRRLQAALDGIAPQVIYATGNHDVRAVFHAEMLGAAGRTDPMLQVFRLPGLRIVVLDSTVVGAGHGVLTPHHLAELTAELGTPHPGGSIVVLHHAPLAPVSPLLTYFALDRASRRALAAALDGTDTRMVLAGHHHLAGFGLLGRIPVAVAPSTAIRTDPLAPPGHERTFRSAGFNLVNVYREDITVSVVPVDGAQEVFHLDQDGCAAVIDAHPVDPI